MCGQWTVPVSPCCFKAQSTQGLSIFIPVPYNNLNPFSGCNASSMAFTCFLEGFIPHQFAL